MVWELPKGIDQKDEWLKVDRMIFLSTELSMQADAKDVIQRGFGWQGESLCLPQGERIASIHGMPRRRVLGSSLASNSASS